MKRIFFFTTFCVLMLFGGVSSFGQSKKFDGLWSGTMTKDDGDTFTLTLYIEDNNVYSVTTDDDGDQVKERDNEVSVSKGFGEQITYFWMDKGGTWTETQVFSIVWLSNEELSVYHMRHVSNESDSYDADNTDWGYTSTGTLSEE